MDLRDQIEIGAGAIPILLIGPLDLQNRVLRGMLKLPEWETHEAVTRADVASTLEVRRFPVAVCDAETGGEWRAILRDWEQQTNPPNLIVSSRLADERLWAEVLNLGAYDVLARPFAMQEVGRVMHAACQDWYRRMQRAAGAVRATA